MKRFKYRTILLTVLTAVAGLAAARSIVLLDSDRMPVVAASVTDNKGVNIALSDNQGRVTVSDNAFPLTIKSLGLKTATVGLDTDTVVMAWEPMAMDEVVVSSEGRPVARVICFVRETAGMIADGDTTSMTWEGMVDYLIPVARTKVKGRDTPRVLNARYAVTSTRQAVDSADIVNTLTFFRILPYPRKEVTGSAALQGVSAGTDTVKVSKKGAVMEVHSKTPAGYRICSDYLADKKNHVWSPWFLKMLGLTMDVDELVSSYLFGQGREGSYSPVDLKAMTVTLHMVGRGKFIRKALGADGDVGVNSHIEIYPVDISFLTEQEAKEADKLTPRQEFMLPAIVE